MRLGIVPGKNFVFPLPLRSAFTIFEADRMRLGIVLGKNFVFPLPLRSAFTIFG